MDHSIKSKLYYCLAFFLVLTVFLFILTRHKISFAPTVTPTSTSPSKQAVKLSYVIDGDTIIINGNKKVRYIGIDTPELKTQISPDQCFAQKALDENKKLLENKPIILEKDVSETDKYGRLLRYVWAGNLFINDYLIRNGFAKIDTFPPDTKYYLQFKQAEQEAKDNHRGLWKECPVKY